MTEVEAQNRITNALISNNIVFKDKLNRQYSFDSYEKLKVFLSFGRKTYTNKIKEYEDEFSDLEEKLSSVIDAIISNVDVDVLSIIRTTFPFDFSNVVPLKSVAPSSFSEEPGRSLPDIIQVYSEHGFEVLEYYIDLMNTPNQMMNYLNDRSKQVAAMEYLLFSTGHHSTNRLRRNLIGNRFFNEFRDNCSEIVEDITGKKSEYEVFVNERKSEYNKWFEKKSNELNEFFESARNQRDELERVYSAKLKIEKPAKYMEEKSKKYRNSFIMWSAAAVILSVVVIVLLSIIISPRIEMNDKIIEIKFFSENMPIYSSMIIIAIISLIIYVIRVFIKVALSSKHISEEYKQKHILTYFYLSLLNDDKIDKEVEKYILMSLFDKAETGLIKNDGNSKDYLFDFISKNVK